jgi:hypothetical protein
MAECFLPLARKVLKTQLKLCRVPHSLGSGSQSDIQAQGSRVTSRYPFVQVPCLGVMCRKYSTDGTGRKGRGEMHGGMPLVPEDIRNVACSDRLVCLPPTFQSLSGFIRPGSDIGPALPARLCPVIVTNRGRDQPVCELYAFHCAD